jgi:MYXO-CTERM domain-containing protein
MREASRIAFLSGALTLGLLMSSCSDPSTEADTDPNEPGALRGILRSATADYPEEGRSEKLYALQLKDGSLVSLQFSRWPEAMPGSEIFVWGSKRTDGLHVQKLKIANPLEMNEIGRQGSAVIDPKPLSPPLKAAFVSLTSAYTKEMLDARLTKDDFIKQVMEVTSYGRWTMEFDTFGPFTVPNDCGGTFYDNLGKNGVAAMQAAGIDTTQYKQIQFIIGSAVPACTWGGFGYDGKTPVRTDGERGAYNPWSYVKGDSEGVMVQEIGHNWGLAHEHFCQGAGAPGDGGTGVPITDTNCPGYVEYGSPFTPMSSSNNVYLNAWERIQMNFLAGCNVLTVGTNGSYDLAPITVSCNGPQVLRVAADKAGDIQRYYYIEYRTPVGIEKTNGVIVHYSADIKAGGWKRCDWGGPDCPEDWLINPKGGPRTEALLAEGTEWTTPEGVGIKIASLGKTAKFDLTFPTQGAAPFCDLANTPWDNKAPICKGDPGAPDGGGGGGEDAGGNPTDSGTTGGTGGTGGATGGTGGSTAGTGGSSSTESGCSCRVTGAGAPARISAWASLAGLAMIAQSRRRARSKQRS